METTDTPVRFTEEPSREDCDMAILVGLALARRVLMVIPDGGHEATASRFALEKAMKRVGDHNQKAQAFRIASRVELPALDDQPDTVASPLDAWSDAIWAAVIEARLAAEDLAARS